MDKCTDIQDIAELVIFIREVINEFEIVEELARICSMNGRLIGKDIVQGVNKCLIEKFEFK